MASYNKYIYGTGVSSVRPCLEQLMLSGALPLYITDLNITESAKISYKMSPTYHP